MPIKVETLEILDTHCRPERAWTNTDHRFFISLFDYYDFFLQEFYRSKQTCRSNGDILTAFIEFLFIKFWAWRVFFYIVISNHKLLRRLYQVVCWEVVKLKKYPLIKISNFIEGNQAILQKNCCNFPLKFCATRVFGAVAQTQKFQDFLCDAKPQCRTAHKFVRHSRGLERNKLVVTIPI